MRVLRKYNSIVQHCNKITILFRFCSRKKEIYNRVTLSLYIFFLSKKDTNESVIPLYNGSVKFCIFVQFFSKKKMYNKNTKFCKVESRFHSTTDFIAKQNHNFNLHQAIVVQLKMKSCMILFDLQNGGKWQSDCRVGWEKGSLMIALDALDQLGLRAILLGSIVSPILIFLQSHSQSHNVSV